MKKNFVRDFLFLPVLLIALFLFISNIFSEKVSYTKDAEVIKSEEKVVPAITPLDKAAYDKKLEEIANNPSPSLPVTKIVKDPQTGVETIVTIEPKPAPLNLWPVKTVYPNGGAILPFKRIVAYYGNLYSTKMGVLGQYPEAEMLERLDAEVKKWEGADPGTPVLPALHYIAVVAQEKAGQDGKHRTRMPNSEIDKVLAIAAKIDAIVFLDIQVGFSTIEEELPRLQKYFKLPNVHLGMDPEFSMKGMDPEFSMKGGIRPGKVVGTFDAADINFAAEYLEKIVKENNLSPKVLVVHRYTQKMVTNYDKITPLPEVQIVMHMDGWGTMPKKIGTYNQFIYPEPVQFTGFKLFYKNDVFTPGTVLMTPEEVLKLRPKPVYIQYQ
ncbi:hypothetical protein HYZ82_01560 [Candidatus Nomurabacteria bacterium]|nr:hypothetical protein [Candidatus Nomurabacteria bacterium]